MTHPVDRLNKIQKVEAPPFLYTRILSRIQNKVTETVPVKWAVAMTAGLMVVITINIVVILSDSGRKNTVTETNTTETKTDLSQVFSLQTDNSLYNE
jgi:hypothetical protein